jgi:hypothetical protein
MAAYRKLAAKSKKRPKSMVSQAIAPTVSINAGDDGDNVTGPNAHTHARESERGATREFAVETESVLPAHTHVVDPYTLSRSVAVLEHRMASIEAQYSPTKAKAKAKARYAEECVCVGA